MSAQKPLSSVPFGIYLLLALSLAAHLAWPGAATPASAGAGQAMAAAGHPPPLQPPPALATLRLASLDEPLAAARLALLHVQAADGPGVSWRTLDYHVLRAWLGRALDLDPHSQYPLLAASQVYAAVNDAQRVRLMLAFVHQRYAEDPRRRWPWLAHAAIVARHRLHDPQLAARYANDLRAAGQQLPAWARELPGRLAAEASELAATRTLAGGLLAHGQAGGARELETLARQLERLANDADADAALSRKTTY